jgi:mannose-6-phosphate isomerase-like protein (cupin superfamily)
MGPIKHVVPGAATTEILRIGPLAIRVLSSGIHTSSVVLTISPHTPGFPLYYHRMHQVNFFIIRGAARFVTASASLPIPSGRDIKAGEYVEVPVRTRYAFSNPYEEEAEIFVTYSPGYYVDCLREMAKLCEDGKLLGVKEQAQVVSGWATAIVVREMAKDDGRDEDDEMDEDEEDDEEESEKVGNREKMGPRYEGLKCMA